MIKKHWRTLIITTIVALLPIVVGLVLWDSLPDKIATHFGANNEADGFSSKAFAVFFLPCFLALMEWFCVFVTSLDPRSSNISDKAMGIVMWVMPVLSILCGGFIYSYAMGIKLDLGRIMMAFFALLAIMIGNVFPKTSQNYSVGIKVSWTLNDEENWNHTHRFAGRLWVSCGVLLLLCAAFKFVWVFITVAVIMVALPIIYSYFFYKKHKEQ